MRECGMLLPIASLPSKYGIGCFSKEAYEFVDQLKEGGQGFWQILPLGPTGFGDSPYQAFSAFAGNPYFIDLEILCKEKLLKKAECESFPWGNIICCNTGKVLKWKIICPVCHKHTRHIHLCKSLFKKFRVTT